MVYILDPVKLVGALIILIIGIIIARLSSNFIKKIFQELELDKLMKKTGFLIPFGKYFYLGIRYLIYFGTLVLALRELSISNKELEILFIIAFILIIVFIILAFKNVFPSLIAGFSSKNNFKKGDKVIIDDIHGEIIKVGLLETEIKTNKENLFIPNSILSKRVIKKK